jgi:hypothetical protein
MARVGGDPLEKEETMAVDPIPEGYHSVTPYLLTDDADGLIEFVKSAFGAEETLRMPGPDGKIGHAEVRIGDSIVMLADASTSDEGRTFPAMLMLYVEDTTRRTSAHSRPARRRFVSRRISSTATAAPPCATGSGTVGGSTHTSKMCRPRRWPGEPNRPRNVRDRRRSD